MCPSAKIFDTRVQKVDMKHNSALLTLAETTKSIQPQVAIYQVFDNIDTENYFDTQLVTVLDSTS